ncbi:hypothetical protein ABT010_29000 [Streptomyces sp. NPDC002668]|uniref:hypothetical protein n=1 Tax=Streptomyces sp. NPDC002668 TaxID=3154422 RepID=UPI00332C20B6
MNRGGNGSATQVEHPTPTTARPQDGANTPDTSRPTANPTPESGEPNTTPSTANGGPVSEGGGVRVVQNGAPDNGVPQSTGVGGSRPAQAGDPGETVRPGADGARPDSGSGTISVPQRAADTDVPSASQSGTPRPGADIHPDASRPGADNQSAAPTPPPARPQDLRWNPDAAHTVLTNPDLDPATANSALANASTILTVRAHQVLPGVDPSGIAPLVPRPESRPGVVIQPAMVRAQHLVAAEIIRHGVLSGQVLAGQILPGSVQPGGEVPPVLYGATHDPAQDTVQLGAHTVPLTDLPDFLQGNMGWRPGHAVVLPVPLTPAAPGVTDNHGITEPTLPEVLADALDAPVIVPVAADRDPATTLMWTEVGPDGELNGAAHSLGALLSDHPQPPPTDVKTEAGAATAPDKGKGKATDLEAGTEPQPGPLPVAEWRDEAEAQQAYADAQRAVFEARDTLAAAQAAHAAGVESSGHADGSAVTAASVRVADALAHLSEVERQWGAVTGSEPLPVVEEGDGPVNGPQRAVGVLTESSVGAPPPNLADLLNEVNLHLHNRGDALVAGAEEIAGAYQQLPADLRFAHLRLMAQGIADILQTGQVTRRRGGNPTLLSTQMPQAPVGRSLATAVDEFISAPFVFANHFLLSADFTDGISARTPGLSLEQARYFVAHLMPHFGRHWFTLVKDSRRQGRYQQRDAFFLTPALEKYAEYAVAQPDHRVSQEAQGFFGKLGIELPLVTSARYIEAGYVQYKTGAPSDLQRDVGNTLVRWNRDNSSFNPDFVFTDTMNGCAFAVTDVTSETFTAWHFQSPTSNRQAACRFRQDNRPIDWFGDHEYMATDPKGLTEGVNFLWRDEAGDWQFIGQDNDVSAHSIAEVLRSHPFTRPLIPNPGEEAVNTARIYHGMVNYYLDRLRNDLANIKIPEGRIWQNEREIWEIFKTLLTGQMKGEADKLKEIADSAHEGSANDTFRLLAEAAREFQRSRDEFSELPRWNIENARIKGNAAASQPSGYFPRKSAESLGAEVAERVRRAEVILSLFEDKWATWIDDLQLEADSWISTPAAGPSTPPQDQTSGGQAWGAPASWTTEETIDTVTVEDVGTLPGKPPAPAPDTWGELRDLAEPAAIDTKRFDPRRSGPYEPGKLAGNMGRIRFDARRFQAASGEWISDATVRLHLAPQPGVTAEDTRILAERMTPAVNRVINAPLFELPDGSVFHLNVEFLERPAGAHHVMRVHGEPGKTTTTDVHLVNENGSPLSDYQLLHEFLHFVGLPDRYFAPGFVFRDRPWSRAIAFNGSLTAGEPSEDGPVLSADDLATIGDVFRSGPVIRDLPHQLAGRNLSTPPTDLEPGEQPPAQPLATPPGDAAKSTESALPESDGMVPSGLEPEVSTSVTATETGTGEQVSTADPSRTSQDKGKGREDGRDRTALLPPATQAPATQTPPADQNPPARTPIDHSESDHPEEGWAREEPAPPVAPAPQRTYPWYVDYGALGNAEVRHVPELEKEGVEARAAVVAAHIPDRALRRALLPVMQEILASSDPAKWNEVLAKGRMVVVGERLVWLRPVLTGRGPHGPSASPAGGGPATGTGSAPGTSTAPAGIPAPSGWVPEGDREFRVGTQSTTRTGSRTTTSSASAAALTALQLGLPHASGAPFLAQVGVNASTTESRSAERTVKTAHRTHPEWKDFSAADADIQFLVFVDGEELEKELVVERGLGVVFPPGLPADVPPVGALQDGTVAGPAAEGRKPAVQRPVRSPQYLNALDTVPLITGLQQKLRAEGLPAVTVKDVMTQLEPRLVEKNLLEHARWVLTSGLSTGPIEAAIPGKLKPFRASFTIRAGIDSLQFLGLSEPGPSRGLEGIATNNSAAMDGSSGAGITGGATVGGLSHIGEGSVVTGRLPDAGITGSSTRSGGYSLSSTATRQTEFKSGKPQVTYAAGLGMSVSLESPTHPGISEVNRTVQSELGTIWRGRPQAADFEQRVLGAVHTPAFRPPATPAEAARPPLRPGPVEGQPHVRALPRESGTPLKWEYERPARLDEKLPTPHPREPLALASRKGGGYATTLALPGAELVQDHFFAALKDEVARSGDKVKDWTTVERELSSVFGRPAMEQDLGRVIAGYRRTVWVGNRPYRLFVRGHLLERLPGDRETGMESESVVGAGGGVSGHRGTRLSVRVNAGGGLRVKIRELLSLHLGGFHVFGERSWGKDTSFTGGSKSSRRSKPKAGADEHVYNIVYEQKLTSLKPRGDRKEVLRKPQPDGLSEKTWWLDRPKDVVAQVLVPHAFVPRTPVDDNQAAQVSTAKQEGDWPAQGSYLDFKRGGTAGVVPAFLPAPELAKLAAGLYAKLNRLPDEWVKNPELWPDEIHALADPAVLASAFNDMVGRFGHEGELQHRKGFEQAFRLRLRSYEPEDLGETPAGVDIVDTKEGNTAQGSVSGTTTELGGSVTVGGYVTAAGAEPEPDPADGPIREQKSSVGEGGGHLYLQGRGWASKGWSKTKREDPGQLGRNKAIYKTSPHEVKSLPVFEFTAIRWKGNGEPDEETGYLSVVDGLQLLVPQRVLPDVMPPAPTEPPADEAPGTASAGGQPVRPNRDYLTSDIASGIGRVERLRADQVMDTITTHLQAHGVLPPGPRPPTDSPRPDLLTRSLHQLFSSEALENRMPDLMGTGVWTWLPVPGFLGAVSYIWVRVLAKELETAHEHRPRPDAKLNVAVAATKNTRDDLGTFGSWGGEFHGRGGATHPSGRDGFEANAGYRSTSSRTVSEAKPHAEIYDADPQDTPEEFNHNVVFSIEMGGTTELPQVLDLPVTGVHHALLGMAHHGFDSSERIAKLLNEHRAWTWFEGELEAEGDVRILVPSHLTGPAGDQPVPPISRVYGEEPRWGERLPVPEHPAGLLHRLHPLAVPAAAAVERWAALAASTAKRDPDLQAAEAWKVQGVDFTTTAGPSYAHFTGTGMVKANIAQLLGHTYSVPVNGRQVPVGFRLDNARVVGPPQGTLYDAARFSRDDPSTTHSEAQSSGWSAGAGPRTVGDGAGPTTLYGSAAASGGIAQSNGYAYRDTSNDENPRTGKVKRPYRYYQFDLTVVFQGPKRTLEVKAPRGLFAMLPLGEDGKLLDGLETALPELFGPDRNKDLLPLPDTATPVEGAESTVTVPANDFGRRSHGWSGSPQLRPIPEEDLANLWVPEDMAEELSLSDESATASLSRTTAPAAPPVTTESAASSFTPPPAAEPAPAQPGTTMPPGPAIPEAFLDAPRPPRPAEEPVAGDGGRAVVLESFPQTSPPHPGPEPENLASGQAGSGTTGVPAPHQLPLVTPESENTLDRPAQGTSVVGGSGVRTQTEVVDPSTDTGAGTDAAMAVDPPTPLAQTQPTYQAVPPQPAARSAWAGELPPEGAGVGDGGSGIGTAGGAAFEDRPDPAELIRREYEEAAAATAAAAMTLREAEAAAALAGSAGTAGCQLSVAQAHMQNSSDRFKRAKQFWESAFGS